MQDQTQSEVKLEQEQDNKNLHSAIETGVELELNPEVSINDQMKELEFALDQELSKDSLEFTLPKPTASKKPWHLASIKEMTQTTLATHAVKKAREITRKNELMVEQLRKRAQFLNENPVEFFDQ